MAGLETLELDGSYDFEFWVEENDEVLDLIESEDWEGLVAVRRRQVAARPRDVDSRIRLGEALVAAGRAEEAVAMLAPLHRRRPRDEFLTDALLEALFALGKTEDDFPWVVEPVVLRLDDRLLDQVAGAIRRAGGRRSAADLWFALSSRGYLTFLYEELVAALEEDPRFRLVPGAVPGRVEVELVPS